MVPSSALIAFAAVEHAAFLVLESFLWRSPLGLKIFRMTPQAAEATAVLAMNQGAYNGFLAAGLAWGLLAAPASAPGIKYFFLACVAIAGCVGGATANPRIFLAQACPALLGLVLLRAGR